MSACDVDRAALSRLAEEALKAARARNLSVVTAESCTAGELATVLSDVPGSAEHLQGGFVTYTKTSKSKVLGVPLDLLTREGAVCPAVAAAMASGALDRSPADVAVAITGVAGPEPDEDNNPVGRVCIAAAGKDGSRAQLERHYGDIGRAEVRHCAMADALELLARMIRAEGDSAASAAAFSRAR